MADDLDFTRHFSAKYTVPEPVHSEEAARDIDRLGLIGISALQDKGYFTRIVVDSSSPARKLLDPTKVRILVVEDDDGSALVIEKALQAYGCQTRRARATFAKSSRRSSSNRSRTWCCSTSCCPTPTASMC